MPPETIQIPRVWLEGLLKTAEIARQAGVDNKKFDQAYLYGYIESAKSLLDK